jgi:CubicO group peptidase (beta-lactamase class C family)
MSTALRDLARFGMLFTHGRGDGVVSDRLLRRITSGGRPQLLQPGDHPAWVTHVAYQWDGVSDKGDFYKGGFGDQLLYVAPRKDVVIAYFGTNRSLDYKPRALMLRKMVDELF